MMGHRLFYDQMIADTCQQEQDQITDEVDVTTTKDYMQVGNTLQGVRRSLHVVLNANDILHEEVLSTKYIK